MNARVCVCVCVLNFILNTFWGEVLSLVYFYLNLFYFTKERLYMKYLLMFSK